MRRYSGAQELASNIPYIMMTVLGTAVLVLGLHRLTWGFAAGALYLLYGVAGAFWIMIFVCPHCRYWDTRSCPCGYGRISARLRGRQSADRFSEKFKKHIPVIVPLWFLPVLAGGVVLIRDFSWLLFVPLVIFAVEAFVFLPLFSKRHACAECPQKGTCPWMGKARSSTY
jgi:hypothetical protein